MIILSILIPSIPERHSTFIELYGKLWRQIYHVHTIHPTLGEIEYHLDDSKSFLDGGLSIGKKRESLVNKATGKYLCFLDDDEDIAPNYVETLVRLCHEDKDIVTFRNISKFDTFWMVVDMRLTHTENEQATPEKIVSRLPWHLCPVRSEYAKLYEFENINYGEDFLWMQKVLTHCKTEAHTDKILHQYNHSSTKSESDKIIKAGYV
jgi:hypothetical protein